MEAPADKLEAKAQEILAMPYKKGKKELKRMVVQCLLPATLRGRLWLYMLRNGEALAETPSPQEMYFSRDIPRTFPHHARHERAYSSPGLLDLYQFDTRSLMRLLRAFCNSYPYGYHGGQSSIAAFLLMHMGEADAYYAFSTLVISQRYWQCMMFQAPPPQVIDPFWDSLLSRALPAVFDWWRSFDVQWAVYGYASLATIFTHATDSLLSCAQLWDYYLIFGRPAFFALQLAVHDTFTQRVKQTRGLHHDLDILISDYRLFIAALHAPSLLPLAESHRKVATKMLKEAGLWS